MKMNKKGFTLVELLMVVIIIGILVTLAVPNYQKVVERAKGTKAKANLDMVRKAQIQYRALVDEFADALATLDSASEIDFSSANLTADNDWTYTMGGGGSSSIAFTCEAARRAGQFDGETITIDEDGVITISTTGATEIWGGM